MDNSGSLGSEKDKGVKHFRLINKRYIHITSLQYKKLSSEKLVFHLTCSNLKSERKMI